MDASISFSHSPSTAESYALEQLAEQLAAFEPHADRSELQPGTMDGGLTLAVAIAGLAVSAIGTVISAISLWSSSLPNCSVTVQRGYITESISNLTPESALQLVRKLESQDENAELTVTISRG